MPGTRQERIRSGTSIRRIGYEAVRSPKDIFLDSILDAWVTNCKQKAIGSLDRIG